MTGMDFWDSVETLVGVAIVIAVCAANYKRFKRRFPRLTVFRFSMAAVGFLVLFIGAMAAFQATDMMTCITTEGALVVNGHELLAAEAEANEAVQQESLDFLVRHCPRYFENCAAKFTCGARIYSVEPDVV